MSGSSDNERVRDRWDHRVILENWGLGDPLDHRVPGVKKVHRGRLEQLGTPAFLGLQAPLVPVAPQEVREPWEKKGAQGQLAPGVTPEPRGSLGHLEKGKMESRETAVHLGPLALLAAAETRALGLLALLDLEAPLDSQAPRDQPARMVYQEVQEREGLLANQYVI
ncbi:hypothetical protein Cadr_000022854 [Camelus dromedarius]|uniref:Uncharacterized protein n=1 Tax=Camelus dromedarius TaxID=9838 RepID=A0A5N4CGF7_CAMDR|nr:hypothetical protein Cadr_000022854 [Camelus dromedarius]